MKTIIKDPVCGMEVPDERFAFVHRGETYSFCSDACRARFRRIPEEFFGSTGSAASGEEERNQEVKKREENGGTSFGDYLPLIVIALLG